MKELTIEEKAKAYDEALSVAQETYTTQPMYREWLAKMFPELKESEDEKTRKEIVRFIQMESEDEIVGNKWLAWLEKQKVLTAEEYLQGKEDVLWCIKQAEKHAKDENEMGTCWFAEKWLEKQGKKESDPRYEDLEELLAADTIYQMAMNEAMVEEAKTKAINALSELAIGKLLELEKQDSPNLANSTKTCKVEPKFHEGEWIACEELNTAKIININDDKYEVEFIDGNKGFPHIDYVDRNFHLWTIEDAKDGDVLVTGEVIFIFKKIHDTWIYCHCSRHNNGLFLAESNGLITYKDFGEVHPATKEQRDVLFSKMKEASYEWDAEKKELKKIEHKPADWSEYDEGICRAIINDIANDKSMCMFDISKGICDKKINWLKSIKDRVTPQSKQEWSEDDEKIVEGLNNCIDELEEVNGWRFTYVNDENVELCKIRNWLKLLKDRYTWKPSDEQMEALDDFIYAKYPNIEKHGAVVKSLYQDLKKLREE